MKFNTIKKTDGLSEDHKDGIILNLFEFIKL